MFKTIALSGVSDKGKTTCLQKVIGHFKKEELVDLLHGSTEDLDKIFKKQIVLSNKNCSKDFIAVFEKHGKRIGITTYGDSVEALDDAFSRMQPYNCQVYVCACHPHGKTIDFVKKESEDFIIHDCWAVETSIDCNSFRDVAQNIQVAEIYQEIIQLAKN